VSQTQTTNTVEKTGAEAVQVLGSQATSTVEAPQQTEQVVAEQPIKETVVQEPKEGTPEWATKRFSELTAQREDQKRLADDAVRERDFYKKIALEKVGQPSSNQPVVTTPNPLDVEPKVDDFTDYGDFVKASVTYQVTQALRTKQSEDTITQTVQERTKKFFTSAEPFKKETPDFDALVQSPTFVQSDSVVEGILHSTKGPQIAYFLAKNPEITSRLNQLSPFEVALEIGRMEERLTPPAPKVITQAPKPLQNVSGGNEVVMKEPEKMNMDEYAKANEHRFAWRGKTKR